MRSIRKFVGGGAAALALGGFLAFIVAPQLAAAGSSHRIQAGVAASFEAPKAVVSTRVTAKVAPNAKSAVTPTAQCISARTALDAARAKDKAEDDAERAANNGGTTADAAEDKAEWAALKPLVDAVRSTCGFTKPTPSAQCTAAVQALKTAIQKEQAEDAAEKSAGTEGTAADTQEDQTEKAQILPLWNAVRTACGFGTTTHTSFQTRQFSTPWHH